MRSWMALLTRSPVVFAARSPVFSAMFEHEMEESKKVISIPVAERFSENILSDLSCVCTVLFYIITL